MLLANTTAPSPEALQSALNVFFYLIGGLGGLALCINQGKQIFQGKTVYAKASEVTRIERGLTKCNTVLCLVAQKVGVEAELLNALQVAQSQEGQ